MLAKILEDMWVEPEVLEALSEEQKRILFFKMREEQVRRWREREEREEREGNNNTGPKKAYSKHVSWLLGRDGDVSVSVIGEVDEFRSSKLLQSLMNNRVCSDNMNGIQTADSLPGRDTQQLSFKEEIQLSLTDDDRGSPNGLSSEEDMDSCSADDNSKDPAEDSDSESGSSSDNHGEWVPLYRPHLSSHGNPPSLKAQQLSGRERHGLQDRGDQKRKNRTEEEGRLEILCCEEKNEGRVVQLRKAFTDRPHSATPAHAKPPLPVKPAHLQKRSTPLI